MENEGFPRHLPTPASCSPLERDASWAPHGPPCRSRPENAMGIATSFVSWGGLGICLGIGGLGWMGDGNVHLHFHSYLSAHPHMRIPLAMHIPFPQVSAKPHMRDLHHLHAHRTDARLWRDYDETGATTRWDWVDSRQRVWQEGARPRRDLGETLATSQPHPTIPGHIRFYFAGHIRWPVLNWLSISVSNRSIVVATLFLFAKDWIIDSQGHCVGSFKVPVPDLPTHHGRFLQRILFPQINIASVRGAFYCQTIIASI